MEHGKRNGRNTCPCEQCLTARRAYKPARRIDQVRASDPSAVRRIVTGQPPETIRAEDRITAAVELRRRGVSGTEAARILKCSVRHAWRLYEKAGSDE